MGLSVGELTRALAAIPERQRRALLLREFQGMSYEEIAGELGVSVAAVETLLFRARRSVADQLEQTGMSRRRGAAATVAALFRWFLDGSAIPLKLAAVTAAVATTATLAVAPVVRTDRPAPVRTIPSTITPGVRTKAPAPVPIVVGNADRRAPGRSGQAHRAATTPPAPGRTSVRPLQASNATPPSAPPTSPTSTSPAPLAIVQDVTELLPVTVPEHSLAAELPPVDLPVDASQLPVAPQLPKLP